MDYNISFLPSFSRTKGRWDPSCILPLLHLSYQTLIMGNGHLFFPPLYPSSLIFSFPYDLPIFPNEWNTLWLNINCNLIINSFYLSSLCPSPTNTLSNILLLFSDGYFARYARNALEKKKVAS